MARAEPTLADGTCRAATRWFGPAIGLALLAWCFRGAIFGGELFAFRDTAHYYYPLYRFVQGEWGAGRLPLWNPRDNLGQPLAGDPTAAVFYPAKLVFALPIGYDAAFRLYVVGHVALAAVAAFAAARRLGVRAEAAALSALAYAFSGSVLFQYCNVVYLVGAAWLPFGLGAIEGMLAGGATRSARFGQAAALSLVLAMMMLGGDVQTAYHLVVLAALRAVARRGADATADQRAARPSCCLARLRGPAGWFGGAARRLGWVAAASAAAGALAAVQLLPAWQWASVSPRAAVTWTELAAARFTPGTHGASIHEFSVAPWRWAETLWPNVAGRQFPEHRRWFSAIPAEGRLWTPSLYAGAMPLIFALGAMRFRPRRTALGAVAPTPPLAAAPAPPPRLGEDSPHGSTPPPDAWLTWVVVLSLVAALGWFGLGWLLHESVAALGGRSEPLSVGPPLGGLYWLLTLVLPGYARFRYPAKWLVVAAAAMALLAARGFDSLLSARAPRAARWAGVLGVLSASGALAAVVVRPWWARWFAGAPSDPFFGPFDPAGAWADLFWGFVQTGVLAGLVWWLARRARPGQSPAPSPVPDESGAGGDDATPPRRAVPRAPRPGCVSAVVLVATALDLAAANGWMVATAPASLWHDRSALAEAIRKHVVGDRASTRGDAMAKADTGSTTLRDDSAANPRVWRRPLWLPPRFSATASADRLAQAVAWDRDTLFPKYHLAEHVQLAEVRGALDPANLPGRDAPASGAPGPRYRPRDLAEFVVLSGDEVLDGARPIAVDVEDVSLWRRPGSPPRVFIQREPGSNGAHQPAPLGATQRCAIVAETPTRVEIDAVLRAPGRVVLADRFDPGWRLEVSSDGGSPRRAAVEPYDGWLRAVELPPGRHRLVFRYRPASVALGALLSAAAWTGLLIALAARAVANRRRHGEAAGPARA